MKKIGVLGGTFDPVHKGHISLALDAKEQAGLHEVLLMPAKLQPFKLEKEVTNKDHRAAMLTLSIDGLEGIKVSNMEMEMEGLSYTYKTLRKVKELYGQGCNIFFITGTDTYLKMNIWKNAKELLSENNFIVGERPGYKNEELRKCKEEYEKTYGTNTIIINNKRLDISSTDIREKVKSENIICELVPEGVSEYIYDKKLYI